MKRKIIRQGNDSFTLTLPIKWVRGYDLKEGNEVDISDEEGSLVIRADLSKAVKEKTIDIDGMSEKNLRFALNNLYRSGVFIIQLKSPSKEQTKIIENLADSHFTGVEITKKTNDLIVMEVLTETKKETFETLLRKIFLIIHDSLSAISSMDDLNRVIQLTNKARAYEQFCKRHIANNIRSLSGYETYALLSYLIIVQTNLEKIAKLSLAEHVKKIPEAQKIALVFEKMTTAFYEKEIKALYTTQELSLELVWQVIKSTKKENPIIAFELSEIPRIFYSMHSPMIGMTMSK